MTLRVFHPPGRWEPGQRLSLDADESHYLLRVRRARPGAAVDVLDGQASAWSSVLVPSAGQGAVLELRRPHPPVTTMTLELLLVVPEPRATLESLTHACELGATAIWLVEGERSPGGRPSAGRIAKTLRAAQRQCGRMSPPTMHGPTCLGDALERSAGRPGYVASVRERDLASAPPVFAHTGARLLVGPEGGLSTDEHTHALDAGFHPLGLGPWILRTPTAVTAGLARLRGQSANDSSPGPRP